MAATLADAKALARAGRDAEAVALIEQLSVAGDADAAFLHGEMCWRGGLVDQNLGKARELYRRAGDGGHARGHAYYTNLLASGIAGERDWQTAIGRLGHEARADPVRATISALINKMDLDADGNPKCSPEEVRLSDRPDARLVRGLATADECRHLITVAKPGYQPSMVFDDHQQWVRDPIRTSDGSPIHWLIEDPAVHAINRRIAMASGTPYENGETLQSLRYQPGQEYRPHYDFVAGDNRRLWTCLLYLNEEYEGGETAFVKTGLKVAGRTGDLLIFATFGPDGESDPMAEHAGLPVTRGVKYLATRWIREGRFLPS
jgi:prolyl 4-hydroxylase